MPPPEFQHSDIIADFPWPSKPRPKVCPVFLPFLGCRHRCIFCAQPTQTGVPPLKGMAELKALLAQCRQSLLAAHAAGKQAPELAFYGGTFTAIPEPAWAICMDFVADLAGRHLISGLRCSTRPDSLAEGRLADLRSNHCKTIELGIQTFSDATLQKCRRGHSAAEAINACHHLLHSRFLFSVQLLPGLPGASPEDFFEDVKIALSLGAHALRFYPCVVFPGTDMAKLWQKGQYTPWSLETAISTLADAFLACARANVPVIRMGIAPEAGLAENILAGPWHPSLGSRVMGLALLRLLKPHFRPDIHIFLPQNTRGCIWGWRNELQPHWQGVEVSFWQENFIRLVGK